MTNGLDFSEITRLGTDLAGAAARIEAAADVVVETHAEQLKQAAIAFTRSRHVKATMGIDRPDRHTALIGPTWFVGRFLEHGTVKMAPQPFLGPAADQIEEPFADAAGVAGEIALRL